VRALFLAHSWPFLGMFSYGRRGKGYLWSLL